MTIKNQLNSEFSKPEDSPGFLLWQISMRWQRHIREALKKLDLTHVQFVLLAQVVWLDEHSCAATQEVLANQAAVDRMMVSEVVRALEKKGFVQRKAKPTDGRAFLVQPTLTGLELVRKAIQVVEKADEEFFSQSPLPRVKIIECFKSLYS